MSRSISRDDIVDEGTGPAVLCLHGFPENLTAFDLLASILVADGYRVVRFNQRGYSTGTDDKPRWDYTVGKLARDALQVMDMCGIERCCIVGHDLGGLVAWELGRVVPERAQSLIIVSVPHPAAFLLSLLGIRQAIRSWYFILAQSTSAASCLYSPARARSRERFSKSLARHGLPQAQSEKYLDFLALGDRFTGAIRWYQAMPFSPPSSTWFRATNDVQIVWGQKDAVIGKLSIVLSRLFVKRHRLVITELPGASHWLVDQRPSDIAEAVRRAAGSSGA